MSGRPGSGRHLSATFATACCLLSLAAASVRADSSSDLRHALKQLQSPRFADREQASDTLFQAGDQALPLLRNSLQTGSPEVRYRIEELLQKLEADHLLRQQERIESGQLAYGEFPAWDSYRTLFGDDESARQLFLKMNAQSSELLMAIGTPDLPQAFDRSLQELQNLERARIPGVRNQPVTEGEIAAVLLAACQPDCVPNQLQCATLAHHIYLSSPGNRNTQGSPILKELIRTWVARPDLPANDIRLRLANSHNLPEGIVPARHMLLEGNATRMSFALTFIEQNGTIEDVPLVETLLTNKTVTQGQQFNPQPNRGMGNGAPGTSLKFETQVCDLALVTLLRISKQDPVKFGMENYKPAINGSNVRSIGFNSEDAREKALAKWKEWRARNLPAHLPNNGWAIEGRTL